MEPPPEKSDFTFSGYLDTYTGGEWKHVSYLILLGKDVLPLSNIN